MIGLKYCHIPSQAQGGWATIGSIKLVSNHYQ